ncbi:MAG: non-canonical purine NTP pyrophosphatase [Patescibacteria group bacterium]|mgnify:CR=1 FL=1
MNLKYFTFITSNKNKALEIRQILGPDIKIKELDLDEIQSLDIDKVIKAKAKAAYEIVKKPVVVEDISFEIKALNGLPGTFIKFFLMKIGTEGTVKLIGKNSSDTTVTAAIGAYDGQKLKIFKGVVKGTLSKTNKGESGFGFDRIFIPTGYNKTYAQLDPILKNKISHRAKALKKLSLYLSK